MRLLLLFCVIAITLNTAGQAQVSTKVLDSLLLSKSYDQASENLASQIAYLRRNALRDSLYKYPYYVGRIAYLRRQETDEALRLAENFTETIIRETTNKRTHYKSLINLTSFYDELGKNAQSLSGTQRALRILEQIPEASPAEFGEVKYNLGATFLSLGDIKEAKTNFLSALEDFETDKTTLKSQLSDAYNAVGASMWLTSKLDSAAMYYSKAVETIVSREGDPMENLYLATIIESNISLLLYSQGKLNEAVDNHKTVIANFEKVINGATDENTVSKARSYQLDAITNLSVFYNELGNVQNSLDLLEYAYDKRKQFSERSDIDLIASNIQIGQASLSVMEFHKAKSVLVKSLAELDAFAIANPYWRAAAWHALAEAEIGLENPSAASVAFDKSQGYFKIALEGSYNTEYISFIKNRALFLASQEKFTEALTIATDAYKVCKSSALNNAGATKLALVIAHIHYLQEEWDLSEFWYRKVEATINKDLLSSNTRNDSIQAAVYLPKVMVGLSQLALSKQPDEGVLKNILKQLNRATETLEQRKTTVYKKEAIALLIEDYKSVAELSKTTSLKLYELSGENQYLDRVLNFHESSVYNRIRLRMNLKSHMSFKDLPDTTKQREQQLKQQLSEVLTTADNFDTYFKVETLWKSFLDSLRVEYPKYYKMRYAKIEADLSEVQNSLEHATLVRYLTIDGALYAFIINKDGRQFIRLEDFNVVEAIKELNEQIVGNNIDFKLLNSLYVKLWKPLEGYMTSKEVVIVPDGELFNLSFEMLTSSAISSFEEFSRYSLLSKYIISYNYSSLLVDNSRAPKAYAENFVAFSPEFDDAMKANYLAAVKDSVFLDKSYLRLLPQPFSKRMAETYSRVFEGESFLNDKASKRIFTEQAKEHKIIHIGTHAESNNLSPELSRLIFAKEVSDDGVLSNNSLYTYEIYDQNLSSNLAILTACETGRPGYSAGEGMISLAHAFNYAGSESILTSLWKIDERSSMLILDYFYTYLKQGLAKDVALQKAKLKYLHSSKGRLLSPQYWAGLVLIGDAKPLAMETSSWSWWWLIFIGIIVAIWKMKSRKQAALKNDEG